MDGTASIHPACLCCTCTHLMHRSEPGAHCSVLGGSPPAPPGRQAASAESFTLRHKLCPHMPHVYRLLMCLCMLGLGQRWQWNGGPAHFSLPDSTCAPAGWGWGRRRQCSRPWSGRRWPCWPGGPAQPPPVPGTALGGAGQPWHSAAHAAGGHALFLQEPMSALLWTRCLWPGCCHVVPQTLAPPLSCRTMA